MSKIKPESSKSAYYWRKRYYPYYWWRRRYYPDYWWKRRWTEQDTSPEIENGQPQAKSTNNEINVAGALAKAFAIRVDVMFMVKALQYARDKQPDDEMIYDLVDSMLEMYHLERGILDEDDLESLLPEESESEEETPSENGTPTPSSGFTGSCSA